MTAGHYRAPITSDIVEYRWKRHGEGKKGGRENPIWPQKGVDGASESKAGRGRRRAFLVEGGNHCLQALGIHACRLRESSPPPPPHTRTRPHVWENVNSPWLSSASTLLIRGVGWNVIFGQRNMRCVRVGYLSAIIDDDIL